VRLDVSPVSKITGGPGTGKGLDLSFFISSGGCQRPFGDGVRPGDRVGMKDGFGSAYFAITVILALVVTYDAAVFVSQWDSNRWY